MKAQEIILSKERNVTLTAYIQEVDGEFGFSKRPAMLVIPGGGYAMCSDREADPVAVAYLKAGYQAFVLRYTCTPKGKWPLPLMDYEQAMECILENAEKWHVNPNDIGIQGFSAGGHLASAVSTHAPAELRPKFSVLFYPVISMDERVTHKGSCVGFLGDSRSDEDLVKEWSSHEAVDSLTPPAIIILASDDRAVPPLTNGLEYYSALRKAGKKAAFFAYPSGGHGFGFRDTWKYHNQMLKELEIWLKE